MDSKAKIHIHTLYTRSGDAGHTFSADGKKIPKSSLQVEVYGSIDELNAFVGQSRTCLLEEIEKIDLPRAVHKIKKECLEELCLWLLTVQNHLFDLGSLIASPPLTTDPPDHLNKRSGGQLKDKEKKFPQQRTHFLEKIIDRCTAELEPLDSFVLPGGDVFNAGFHICRTVCRRVERQLVRLQQASSLDKEILRYINRLSDFFFALSRWVSYKNQHKEILWQPGK